MSAEQSNTSKEFKRMKIIGTVVQLVYDDTVIVAVDNSAHPAAERLEIWFSGIEIREPEFKVKDLLDKKIKATCMREGNGTIMVLHCALIIDPPTKPAKDAGKLAEET